MTLSFNQNPQSSILEIFVQLTNIDDKYKELDKAKLQLFTTIKRELINGNKESVQLI